MCMKVIKNINNNVSLCLDNNNNEVVAFGKGIGFTKPPYEIPVSQIQRTYYDIDPVYISMINDIPIDIIEISTQIIEFARTQIESPISSNIIFTLADHINFAIQRYQKNMNIKMPIIYDIEHLYEIEMKIGLKAIALIKKKMEIYLPREEAAYIAIHLINAESMNKNNVQRIDEQHIQEMTGIIEKYFQFVIDKKGFNYSRFVTHMHYLLKRGQNHHMIQSENVELFDILKENYQKTYECSILIKNYIEEVLDCSLSQEECLYLILHINRLCSREDCNQ